LCLVGNLDTEEKVAAHKEVRDGVRKKILDMIAV